MERRQQITRVFHAALTLDSRERAAFLADACAGDDELRRQVESLLAEEDTPAAAAVTEPPASPFSGGRLAHYRVGDKLGAGGMGEVYRARDEQLDREIAIKVLPRPSFDDPAARARLVREARAAAALNHPHICTVFEVGESNGQTYIAMELVEGQPLSARLDTGALPIDSVLRYGVQLAGALAHAHERGVVHRDLKSANVIVTPDGRVKVLDFGLAKRSTATDLTTAAITQAASLTLPGTVMGTLPYMAPEQLRGQTAQTPSDIWALGVMLYEMAAGVRPFHGQTAFELSAAILNEAPASLASRIPPALQTVIDRCLEKDPGQRYQSAGEVRAALEVIQPAAAVPRSETRPAVPAVTAQPGPAVGLTRRRAIWLGGAAAISAASGFATWQLWPRGTVSSLAVLPFVNAKADADIDYLCDGIAESLIKQISRLRSVRVSSLSTVFSFRGPAVDPPAAGRQLGVETILTGTLERRGARLLISTQLVKVASGATLWTNSYDRDSKDLLDVQELIASAIMDDGLRLQLSSDERQDLRRHPTRDGEAYDLYLQARHVQRRAGEDDYLLSRQLLERAIIRDPTFALAYAALSGNYAMMVTDGLERPTDAWPQVNRYMRKALELEPNLPDAHAFAHAVAFLFDWDWAGAERERRLLLQTPAGDFDPQVLRALAAERWALGRTDEALQLARRTRELDRLSPYLAIFEADYLVYAGQLDAAVELYGKAISLDPGNANAYFGLSEARYRQRRFDEAIDARRQAHAAAGDDVLSDQLKDALSRAKGEKGYREIDRVWVGIQLEMIKARATSSYVSPLDFARVYAQLDDKEQAFKYLEGAFVDRSPGLVFLKVDPVWNSVRADPRFAAAVKRVGLP